MKLLQQAQQYVQELKEEKLELQKLQQHAVAILTQLAEDHDTTVSALHEAANHILANIAMVASAGQPIKAMSAGTLASFLAGIDHIAKLLPRANPDQRANALRVIQAAGIGPDGLINTSVAPIASLGAKQMELALHYGQIVKQYISSVSSQQPDGSALAQVARQLQSSLDRALRGGVKPSEDLQSKVAAGAQQPLSKPA